MYKALLSFATLIFLTVSFLSTSAFAAGAAGRHQHAKSVKANYRVFGKHYNVLSSSKDYNERGLASWYGRAFHHRVTSSGERYNMYGMTAAHKSLPFRTRVKVTNLANGRQVIVKVNDRGPFVRNRLIDLSYAAAKELHMVGRGVAPVTIKALS